MEELQELLSKRNLTDEDLQTQCSQNALLRLSTKMDTWPTIGLWLELSLPDIEAIRNDCSKEEERRINMLNKWKVRKGSKATYHNLVIAFKECERVDLIEDTLDYLKEKKDEGVDSDSSVQEEDLKLLCGCGNCTLGYFLENGCPNPGVQRQFPLLNVTQLQSQKPGESEKLLLRLYRESEKVNEKFADLMLDVLNCLNTQQEITVEQMVVYISSLQNFSFLTEPTYSDNQKQLQKAKTKGEVVILFQNHVSWFNHSLLGKFLHKFNVEVEKYENYVNNHLKPLLQKSLFEIPRKSSNSFSGSGHFVLKLNVPHPPEDNLSFVPQNVSADIIVPLKDKLASVLGLSAYSLEFCSYKRGCFELVFGGPRAILKEMLFNNQRLTLVLQDVPKMIPGVKIQAISFEDKNQLFEPIELQSPSSSIILPSDAKMTNIDQMLASLVVELTKSIESDETTLSKAQSFVSNLVAHRSVEPSLTDFLSLFNFTDVTKLSLKDFLLLLRNYWSFFNCSLLNKLIKMFGSQEAVDVLKRFVTQLQELYLFEIPTILHHLPQVKGFFPDTLLVTMKDEFFNSNTRSVEDLIIIRNKIANVLRVEHYGLILRRINKEKHQLEFLISETNRNDLLASLTSLELSLINEFILELQFQNTIIAVLNHDTDLNISDSDEDNEECDSGLATTSASASENEASHDILIPIAKSIPKEFSIDSRKSVSTMEHHIEFTPQVSTHSSSLDEETKGYLLVCGLCLQESNNEKLLIERCLQPSVHGQVDAVNARWNSQINKFVDIIQFPQLIPNTESLELYDRLREHDTNVHIEIGQDTSNQDLKTGQEIQVTSASIPVSTDKSIKFKLSSKERDEWKVNFKNRMTKTATIQEEVLESELKATNYRDKFYYLLCLEESEHISTLSEKCDGRYRIQCCVKQEGDIPRYMCRVLGMDDNQIQYAVQASEAVYIVNFNENNEKNDLCQGKILSRNFTNISEYFYVSIFEEDFHKIQLSSFHLGYGWYDVHLEFEVKHSYFDMLHRAVISLPDSMIDKITTNIEGAPEGKIDTIKGTSKDKIHNPHNKYLFLDTEKQIQALEGILKGPVHCPTLVSGPFGSGKTRTLARAAYEFAIGSASGIQERKILICAHHTNTVQTYMKYLEPVLSTIEGVEIVCIVRNGNSQETSPGVYNKTIPAFRRDVALGQHIDKRALIIITTYITSLQVAKVLNRFRFTHILLDEAAQVREPEAIAALSLGDVNTTVAIAGDSKQVGPSVLVLGDKSNQNGLEISLMERLEKRYKQFESYSYLKYLNTNYRCPHMIVEFLSQVIYKHPIYCAPQTISKANHPAIRLPCIFFWSKHTNDVAKAKKRQTEDVVKQVKFYFSKWPPKWKKQDLCVMSPFRTQLNLISSELHALKINEITLLPSYQIQGHEFQAVVLSTLEPLESDGTSSNPTKSLVNPKIFNTVVSRCKSFIVAVGDPFVLLKAEEQFEERCWKHYLQTCLDNDSIYFYENNRQKRKSMKEELKKVLYQIPIRSRSEEHTDSSVEHLMTFQQSMSEPYDYMY